MHIAIISDIHGNMEALQQVLEDIATQGVDETFCLGDCIGYGPEPEQVINTVCRHGMPTVMGNHELALTSPRHLKWFNALARESLEKTMTMLSPQSLVFATSLPPFRLAHGCRFVHGYPPDRLKMYLFQATAAALQRAFERMAEWICFVGHTHELELIGFAEGRIQHQRLGQEAVRLDRGQRYIVNVGSVGQPRDGDNRAKYALFDTAAGSLEIRHVAYDITATAKKIIAVGLPEAHARRLW